MKVLIIEPDEIAKEAIDLLKKQDFTVYTKDGSYDAKNIDVLFVRTYTTVNKEYLDMFPNLRYILRAGVGLDNINLEECKKRNITVINAPGSNANAVAELVVGLMIMLLRNIIPSSNLLHNGKWREKRYIGEEIKGKIVGVVGCGAIGKLLAKKLQGFEVKHVVGYDPFLDAKALSAYGIKKVSIDVLIRTSDIISLHLPLTEETKNLISLQQLKMMKESAYVINTSRGGIVNENDLIQALKEDSIAGAALDVFEHEPDIRKELLSLENLIATPHIAGYTHEADKQMSLYPVQQLIRLLQ